jgi:hypothetical protein
MLFKKVEPEKDIYKEVLLVENDVRDAVVRELVLFKRNPDNETFEQSAIANIALFNLPALQTQKGYDQCVNLFEDHYEQMVGRRINQLLHTLYIRYGKDLIGDIVERTLTGMEDVYNIDQTILHKLNDTVPGFWLQPFIRKAYFDIVDDVASVEK